MSPRWFLVFFLVRIGAAQQPNFLCVEELQKATVGIVPSFDRIESPHPWRQVWESLLRSQTPEGKNPNGLFKDPIWNDMVLLVQDNRGDFLVMRKDFNQEVIRRGVRRVTVRTLEFSEGLPYLFHVQAPNYVLLLLSANRYVDRVVISMPY